jgi:hypothetical protein
MDARGGDEQSEKIESEEGTVGRARHTDFRNKRNIETEIRYGDETEQIEL